jgi:hypothetical protein
MAYTFTNLVSANTIVTSPDPTQFINAVANASNDKTVCTSNCSPISIRPPHKCCYSLLAEAARLLFGTASHEFLNAITIAMTHAISNTGTTSIFMMDGVDVENKCVAKKPLVINLTDGWRIMLTYICNIPILRLPTILSGHIVPDLAPALLIRIPPLCKAGCRVIFDYNKCNVKYNGNVILQRFKDNSQRVEDRPSTTHPK